MCGSLSASTPHRWLQDNNRPEGSRLRPADYTRSHQQPPGRDAPQAAGRAEGGGGARTAGRGAGRRGSGTGREGGRKGGGRGGRAGGAPHLGRRALLQHILLHGHGPRGAGGRPLAPPPARAAALRRAPGDRADGRGLRPRQPGAEVTAAGVRGHRGQAARRGLRGPRRRLHGSVRAGAARAMGGGRGREGAAAGPGALAPGPALGAPAGKEGGRRERPAEWRCPPPARVLLPPLPSPAAVTALPAAPPRRAPPAAA